MRLLTNRYVKMLLFIIVAILLNIATIIFADFKIQGELKFQYEIKADEEDVYQLFFSTDGTWNESNSIKLEYNQPGNLKKLSYTIPKNTKYIRIDLGTRIKELETSNISIDYLWKSININSRILQKSDEKNHIEFINNSDETIHIKSSGNDPYIVLNLEKLAISKLLQTDKILNVLFKILSVVGINVLLLIFIKKSTGIKQLGLEVLSSKELIWKLSKNDFKTKYAGSYLGITWAFVQPIVTILVYWFVFQVGFKSAPVKDFPFVLWLVAGLVPWFFFSEAVMNATNSMIEYSYLVKKIVFKISVLPIVKVISSLFINLFFIGFTVLLFMAYGYIPDLYSIQIIYYTICLVILVLAITYGTCSIIVFFKDLGQIVNIFMQVGMWMTPIMWSYEMIPEHWQWILKVNPMYYIVQGYRDSLIHKVWFWERTNQTIYFWIIVSIIFGIGALTFKRLKVHFADVL